jgi:hypothetical protein
LRRDLLFKIAISSMLQPSAAERSNETVPPISRGDMTNANGRWVGFKSLFALLLGGARRCLLPARCSVRRTMINLNREGGPMRTWLVLTACFFLSEATLAQQTVAEREAIAALQIRRVTETRYAYINGERSPQGTKWGYIEYDRRGNQLVTGRFTKSGLDSPRGSPSGLGSSPINSGTEPELLDMHRGTKTVMLPASIRYQAILKNED